MFEGRHSISSVCIAEMIISFPRRAVFPSLIPTNRYLPFKTKPLEIFLFWFHIYDQIKILYQFYNP